MVLLQENVDDESEFNLFQEIIQRALLDAKGVSNPRYVPLIRKKFIPYYKNDDITPKQRKKLQRHFFSSLTEYRARRFRRWLVQLEKEENAFNARLFFHPANKMLKIWCKLANVNHHKIAKLAAIEIDNFERNEKIKRRKKSCK